MKALRFLGIAILIFMGFAYLRGWIAGSKSHEVRVREEHSEIAPDEYGDDAESVAHRFGDLASNGESAVKAGVRESGAGESALEGQLSSVDAGARELTVHAGPHAIALHVPSAVPITRDGASFGLDQMAVDMKARFVFTHTGEEQRLARIEILR